MASFLTDLWESIFVPGPTASIVKATNAAFAALQLILACLLIATSSAHFVILSVLSAGLWWAINWFAREVAFAQQQQEKGREENKVVREGDDSDTEVEQTARDGEAQDAGVRRRVHEDKPGSRTVKAPAPTPTSTTMTTTTKTTSGTTSQSSSVSTTEDEWEKISQS